MRESEQNRSTFVRRNLFKVSILYLAAKRLFGDRNVDHRTIDHRTIDHPDD